MTDFTFYFHLGWKHIISLDALDHLLFITALAALYSFAQWREVLVLVTAFTIGHSLTLALSVYNMIRVDSVLVEFLIPLTIVITAALNLMKRNSSRLWLNYILALFFGLIHVLGFANTIRFMLASDQQIGIPLFSFNLGLEVGQIVVVLILLLLSQLIVYLNWPRKYWTIPVSLIVIILAARMAIERWPSLNNIH